MPEMQYIAALGDLYQATGQRDQAEIQSATVEHINKLSALNQQI